MSAMIALSAARIRQRQCSITRAIAVVSIRKHI
jgi:hypothetical protein